MCDTFTFDLLLKALQAAYCSSECQQSAWKTHKAVCGSPDQLEQHLPSQNVIAEIAKNTLVEMQEDAALLKSKRDEVRRLYSLMEEEFGYDDSEIYSDFEWYSDDWDSSDES
jgi:hypothetical protein